MIYGHTNLANTDILLVNEGLSLMRHRNTQAALEQDSILSSFLRFSTQPHYHCTETLMSLRANIC
jgi:hypothetical protein